MFNLYLVTNTVNWKVYVGQTTQEVHARWKAHLTKARCGSTTYFHNAIRKYGESAFTVETVGTFDSQEALTLFEMYWIDLLKSNTHDNGYNITDGGECGVANEKAREAISKRMMGNKHALGTIHSEETIKKMAESKIGNKYAVGVIRTLEHRSRISAAQKGRTRSPEHCAAISAGKKGKRLTDEQIARGAASRVGLKRSAETKAKMSAARKLWWERHSTIS